MIDLIIDGVYASEYNLSMVERPSIPTPERKITTYEIDGRHGSLTELGTYQDMVLPITLNLLEEENIKDLIRQIKTWLLQCKVLFFSDDTVFYQVKHVSIGDIANEIEEYGLFDVTFTLDPFAYSNFDTISAVKDSTLYNPGTYEAEPIIKVSGTGDVRLQLNSTIIQLKQIDQFIVLDSEMQNCYKGTEPLNHKMSGEFPVLIVGENTISWTGNVTKVEIEGRWRFL